MIKFINNEEYIKNKLEIQKLIAGIFKNDNDKIANLEETMEHLDFIFAQKNNKAFLLLNIEDDALIKTTYWDIYDEIKKDKNLTWIESEQIIFAWLDKDNQVAPLTDEQLNPVWKILNYETGKYESVQKHFRVFEV